jgi:Protein of unknown function (DUF2530)
MSTDVPADGAGDPPQSVGSAGDQLGHAAASTAAGRPAPPRVEPITVNSARVVLVGTSLWAIAFVALLPFYTELGHHHHRNWLWTCLAGIGVGAFGYLLTRRHKATGRTD